MPRPLLFLLLLLLLSIAAAVTLRSGKAVGSAAPPQHPPQQQQQQQPPPPQHPPQPIVGAGAGGIQGLLQDAAVFAGHHLFALGGLGATAGSIYRYAPQAAKWVRSRECFQAGSAAAYTSKPYVTTWERNIMAAFGGLQACLQRMGKEAPKRVPRAAQAVMPRRVNPFAKQQAGLPFHDWYLTAFIVSAGLAWLWYKKGLGVRSGLLATASLAATGLGLAMLSQMAWASRWMSQLEDLVRSGAARLAGSGRQLIGQITLSNRDLKTHSAWTGMGSRRARSGSATAYRATWGRRVRWGRCFVSRWPSSMAARRARPTSSKSTSRGRQRKGRSRGRRRSRCRRAPSAKRCRRG
jgi:hypothetical protein